MRGAVWVSAATATLAAAGYAVAGPPAAAAVATAAMGLVMVVARAATPRVPRGLTTPQGDAVTASFPSYRRIVSMLGASQSNAHHYEAVTRRFLADVTAALLVEKRGLDLREDRETVQQLLGADASALVDPSATRGTDARVTTDELTNVVDRLEAL